jgi:THO complex subunit 4
MAIITFQRPGDAAAAREKYDGKLIDGSKLFKLISLVHSARLYLFCA